MLREKETKKKLLNALECAADLEPENTKVEEKPSLEDVFINEDDIFDIKFRFNWKNRLFQEGNIYFKKYNDEEIKPAI